LVAEARVGVPPCRVSCRGSRRFGGRRRSGGVRARPAVEALQPKVSVWTYTGRSAGAGEWRASADCGHSVLRAIAGIGRCSSDTPSINHLVHVREDSRDFGAVQARRMALAIETDKASDPSAKSLRRAGVVVLDLDCVADSGKQRDGRNRPCKMEPFGPRIADQNGDLR
jgi:hypothetical protein